MGELEKVIADELMDAGVGVIFDSSEEIAAVAAQAIRQYVAEHFPKQFDKRQVLEDPMVHTYYKSTKRILHHLDLLPHPKVSFGPGLGGFETHGEA